VREQKAVHAGHQHIGDDHGRFLLGHHFEGFFAVGSGEHQIAAQLELKLDQLAHCRNIFDDQQWAGLGCHNGAPSFARRAVLSPVIVR
jgi:hypothetical protein